MAPRTSVLVEAESNDAAETFVRDYAVEAVDRLPKMEGCEWFSYISQGHPDEPFDRRYVNLLLYGDAEAIIEEERPRWQSYVDEGLLIDWEVGNTREDGKIAEEYGEEVAELSERLMKLETDIATRTLEEFDELPAPVDELPEKSPYPVGWWGVPHTVMHQLNYDLADELDVYRFGIEHTLRNYAEHDSPERADEELDKIIERLEDKREIVKEGRWDS